MLALLLFISFYLINLAIPKVNKAKELSDKSSKPFIGSNIRLLYKLK
jgi:hypothetical protein